MSKETYIVIGLCIFALLLGARIKNVIKSKAKNHKQSKRKSKSKQTALSSAQIKLRRIFTIAMLIVVFGLLIFMIPALSRDVLTSNGNVNENLILRILIVGFAIYILFMGYLKIRKSK
ncbi:hypothetical protein [Marinifilum sp.]|uniref:hypothetical protein n=1 Tax=Marinifilum sp. TaxID=2033137 RepID=UPI003BAC226B